MIFGSYDADNNVKGKYFNKVIHMQSCYGIGYDETVKECNKCSMKDLCKIKTEDLRMSDVDLVETIEKLNPDVERLINNYAG